MLTLEDYQNCMTGQWRGVTTVMGENRHKQSIDSVTKKWAILAGLCTSPLFVLFTFLGDPGRGQAAWVSALSLATATRFLWDLRRHVWFWITIAVIAFLHVPLILLIPWPLKQLSYVALLPAGFLDFVVAYGLIRVVENVIDRNAATDSRT
jgi:hypothetical protein